ncbi:MAG: NAD-dependent epimerase/dehydratase family protein [Deltaproteobacteria bacterium]|nr:NAD-dependent epimerase/dehydratase family protein [Deltaproteobacteria bacterium]
MKVTITGATGFVGERLAASLLEDGDELRALVPPSIDPEPLLRRGFEVIAGDVRDRSAVERALAGSELVYHLAAVVPGAARTRADYHAVNVGGTENVVRAAVSTGVRHLVHCSTVAVHGSPHCTLADEQAPLMPVNAYQTTKLAAECVVDRAVRADGLSAVIARLTPLYGPADRRSFKLFRDVARGRLLMIGAGIRRRQLTYVDDAVAGLKLCAARVPSPGERFIIGGEERPTVNELVSLIAGELGVAPRIIRLPSAPFALGAALYRSLAGRFGPPPGLVDRLDFFLAGDTYDVSKARRELGFRSQVSLRDGVRRTAASYREMGIL